MEAKFNAKEVPISTKKSVEIFNLIRGKKVEDAKKILENVIEQKEAVPYVRYNRKIPHRKGKMATGRFPVKSSKEILKILKSAESNAQNLGLSSNLIISHISAHKASMQFHYGRKRRRRMKRTHVNMIVQELKEKKKPKKQVDNKVKKQVDNKPKEDKK